MSKESKPKRTRSTKSRKAELEAKIAELEAKLAKLSSQVQPAAARPAETRAPPPPPKPAPRPEPKPAPQPEVVESIPQTVGEVSPAYATISPSGYTGNRYYATRRRLAYHPPDKQYRGTVASTTTTRPSPPPPPAPEPEVYVSQTHGTLPSEMKAPEKKSLWRSRGAEYENYVSGEEKKGSPPPAPKPEPKPAPKPDIVESKMPEAVGEVAPAYATVSSTEYTGNRYYATRKRMSYHPPDKQYTGASTTAPSPAAEPPKPKVRRGTLPAGFKP